jgi:hypothetical protein
VHHTGHDLAANFPKGMVAVSISKQEQKFQGKKKRAVQLYSSSYGCDHQSDLMVNQQDNAFG